MNTSKMWKIGAAGLLLALSLSACSSAKTDNTAQPAGTAAAQKGAESKKLTIVYPKWNEGHPLTVWFPELKTQFEKSHPGVTVTLQEVQGKDYGTKLPLMLSTDKNSPDVIVEDTFMVNSDSTAGYLTSLDDQVKAWKDWPNFNKSIIPAVTGKEGKIYGVPYNTDTRGLYYNVNIFKNAGLPVPWEPKTWDDILTAAKTIKEKAPDVTPFWAFSSKAAGEGTSMQTFEMLLYGTNDTLYDQSSGKWVVKSKGFQDSLSFIDQIYSNKLGPDLSKILNAQADSINQNETMPNQKVGIVLQGNWVPATWLPTGSKPWPEGIKTYEFTAMPTQNGQAPGHVSMSGGWALSIPKNSTSKDLAWEFIQMATNFDNMKKLTMTEGSVATRTDVAQDPEYANTPGLLLKKASEFISFTHVRPAYPEYPQVSSEIQDAVEKVVGKSLTPEKAMEQYANKVKKIVGDSKIEEK